MQRFFFKPFPTTPQNLNIHIPSSDATQFYARGASNRLGSMLILHSLATQPLSCSSV